eukprot:TRINITY_DN25037_c0_g1_i1.p1 TRINITY_DN25037_c0_g1~~TRINITY_DN25037_c0_g1_i1.p1  ORF type:complete len:721 (+),score=111.25 TRINITY_DN25037_c0_g1_i1:41-2203(+)
MGNACWGAGSNDVDETFARIGVIFRFFDRDGDGLWNYTEACRWGEVMRGSKMTQREYEQFCRKLDASTTGLKEEHIAKAYGKGSTLNAHYKKLLSFGDIRNVPNHLFLVPGMKVQIHQLLKDSFLNNTKAIVISVVTDQNAAMLETYRGPLLVPLNNILYPIRPVVRQKRILVLSTGNDATLARENLYVEMSKCRGFEGSDWCIPRDIYDNTTGLTKSEVFKWLHWCTQDSHNKDIIIALLSDPNRSWQCSDSSFVGPLTSDDIYHNLVHSMDPLSTVTMLETGITGDSLMKDLPEVLTRNSNNTLEWKSLRKDGKNAADGCTPAVLWLTSLEHPAASGRYVRSSLDFNDWPMWEGTDEKRLYLDSHGYWKVAMSAADIHKSYGILRSESRIGMNPSGDRLPGFVGCWYYSLHSRWAKCAQTAVTVSPPALTVISGNGMSVAEFVAHFCNSLSSSNPERYPEGEGRQTGLFYSHLSGLSSKITIRSMHAPDLSNADRCYTLPDCGSPANRERYLSAKGLPLKHLPGEDAVSEAEVLPDFYEEQDLRSPFRERTMSTDGGLGAFLDGLPRDSSKPQQSPVFNEQELASDTVTESDAELKAILQDNIVVAAAPNFGVTASPKHRQITVTEEVKPPSILSTPTATPTLSSVPSHSQVSTVSVVKKPDSHTSQPLVFSHRLKGLIQENHILDRKVKQALEERITSANSLVEENLALETMIERFF